MNKSVYMSEFEGDPSDFLECLRTGKLNCIFVAKGLFNSYFLIIEPEGKYSRTSARRVGVAEVIWSKDVLVYRFADEVKFQGAKRDIPSSRSAIKAYCVFFVLSVLRSKDSVLILIFRKIENRVKRRLRR